MCIIAIKKANVKMISKDIIKTCFDNNPDGAGYMFLQKNKVIIRKGFMTVDALLKSLKTVKNIDIIPLILHFRIGTHGKNNQQNTHPYPISKHVKALQLLSTTTNLGVVHNGIIDCVYPRAKINDTMEYILTVLYPLYRLSPNFYTTDYARQIIEATTYSKFAFLDSEGVISVVGEYELFDGIFYSNSNYKKHKIYSSKEWLAKYNANYYDELDKYNNDSYKIQDDLDYLATNGYNDNDNDIY